MFKSESLHWLGAFKSEMMKSCDGHTDTRTQPFIVKDDKSYQQEFKMNYCNNLQDKNKVLILAHFIVQKRKNIHLYNLYQQDLLFSIMILRKEQSFVNKAVQS